MNRYKKYCLLLISIMLIFSGCQSAAKTKQTTSSQNNVNKTSNNNSTGSVSNTVSNFNISPGAVVNPGSFGSPIRSSLIFQSGNSLYCSNWYDNDKLYKMNLDGTGIKKISDDAASELIVSNNIIYYSNESDHNKLYCMNVDGTQRKKLLDESVRNLELLGTLIYYIDPSNTIATLDISNNKKISLSVKSRCFDSDGTYIYYEDYMSKDALSSIKIDGSGYGKLSNDAPMSIASESGVVYYANGYDNNKIYKLSSDGTGAAKLNDFKSSNLVFDNGWIYYINGSDFDKIYKIKTDGSSNTMVSSESFVSYFAIAGNYIFFKKNTDVNHSIYKTNK